MQSRPRHQTLYSQCLQPHCLPAIRCPLSYPDSTRQRSALLYPFVLRLPGKLPLPRQCSTGQTRSSKNCQGKRVVLKMFWSARYCGQDGAGKYQEDAVQTGFVSITTRLLASQQEPLVLVSGNVSRISGTIMSVTASTASQGAYGYESQQRTADRTRPENVALPTALYLGRPAQV